MFKTYHGHGRDEASFLSNSRQFLGLGVQAMSRMRQGHILTFRHFLAISGTQCAGHVRDASWPRQGPVLAAVGMHPDFQAFVSFLWARCACHILTAIGTQSDFQAFLSNFWDSLCRPCSGHIMAMVRTEPKFQAVLGSFWGTMCRPCPGCGKDAS
ncbi:Hypothetical predicted protein [Olea europaea subsp. europaea]|uniref:Uncharacterized protein n=1 Tax=Olea europaea subsp. europaea TaxID=158383 RepID=A0A8S0S0Y3_OLEEU|nr:Hypothetical predicted protein [Olea europaea subsp. europaea]